MMKAQIEFIPKKVFISTGFDWNTNGRDKYFSNNQTWNQWMAKRSGYDTKLSAGAIAAGGTLGILIPPSVILIIYSILTEQNIAKMFLAAFIPGFLAAVGYITAIAIYVRFFPNSGPNKNRVDFKSRFLLFKNI